MLRRRDIVILIVAILCGAVAFVIVSNILRKSAQLKQRYVMTAQALSTGQIISGQDIALSNPVENADSADLFLQPQDVVGNEVLEEISRGQLVRRSLVRKPVPAVAKAEPRQITLPVPPGKRALTVAANEIEDVPQALSVGNFVDILGNAKMPDGRVVMKTVVRGAQVISVDHSTGPGIKSATVALSPTGTEMVAVTLTQGKLRFVVVPDGSNAGVVQDQSTIEIIRGVEKEVSNRGTQAGSSKT